MVKMAKNIKKVEPEITSQRRQDFLVNKNNNPNPSASK
jgi:hypothetical protein